CLPRTTEAARRRSSRRGRRRGGGRSTSARRCRRRPCEAETAPVPGSTAWCSVGPPPALSCHDGGDPTPGGRVRKDGCVPSGPQTRHIPASSVAPIPSGIGAPCDLGLLGLTPADHERPYERVH